MTDKESPIIRLIDFDIEVNEDMAREEEDQEFQISCVERIGELTVLKTKIMRGLPISLEEEKIVKALVEMWIFEVYELENNKE